MSLKVDLKVKPYLGADGVILLSYQNGDLVSNELYKGEYSVDEAHKIAESKLKELSMQNKYVITNLMKGK